MIPNQVLSSIPVPRPYLEKVNDYNIPLVDYEMGGVALNDASQGLQVKLWTLYLEGDDVKIKADDVAPTTIFTAPNITELSLTFDQSMNVVVAYVQADEARLYWFDTALPGYTSTVLVGATSPRVSLDDKRPAFIPMSDVILGYIRDGNLYFRAQRDRYGTEYLLKTDVNATLVTVGMTTNNRFKFKLKTLTPIGGL